MTRIKYLLLIVCMAGCLAACKKDDIEDNFDQEAQFRADTTAIRSFITTNNIPALKDEDYGLFYQIIEPGAGDIEYAAFTQITASYEGRLLNKTVFDTKENQAFMLGDVIAGWQAGIQKIQKGGKIRLIIPSFYGFGHRQNGPVPMDSILDFTIELTDVQNP